MRILNIIFTGVISVIKNNTLYISTIDLSTARPKWRLGGPALSGHLLYSLVTVCGIFAGTKYLIKHTKGLFFFKYVHYMYIDRTYVLRLKRFRKKNNLKVFLNKLSHLVTSVVIYVRYT